MKPEKRAESIETVPVMVARTDIPVGVTVVASLVDTQQWPKTHLPPGAITRVEDAVERATTVRVFAGEPLLDGKLAAKGSGSGLAAIIPKGMRAYTIQSAQVAANVAGFVLPGNRVDVLLNLRSRNDRNDPTGGGSTTTLLQAVEVLAVDQRLDIPTENKVDPNDLRSITLLVTPEQADLLALGQTAGTLSVSLRHPEDLEDAKTVPVTLRDLWRRQEGPLEEGEQEGPPSWVADASHLLTKAFAVVSAARAAGDGIADEPEKRRPETYSIRTVRGVSRGVVNVNVGHR
jgi:pilus assembly protein CpaB